MGVLQISFKRLRERRTTLSLSGMFAMKYVSFRYINGWANSMLLDGAISTENFIRTPSDCVYEMYVC